MAICRSAKGELRTPKSNKVCWQHRTRNQVVRKGTWVRIPPAPPKKPLQTAVCGGFLIEKLGKQKTCPLPFCYHMSNVITVFFDNI